MRPLPPDFEARYVASRTLNFLPLFGAFGLLAARQRSAMSPPTVVVMLLGLALVAGMARKRANTERPILEAYANEDLAWLRGLDIGKAKTDILPATLGGLLSGGIAAAIMEDVRWLVLGFGLSGLIFAGLALRWFVYDRWLDGQLARWTPSKSGLT